MDHALTPPVPFDRRKLVTLVLAGATGAALAEAGIMTPAGPWEGELTLDSVRRTLGGLAALYDEAGPSEIQGALKAAEMNMHTVFAEYGKLPKKQLRDAKAVYAQLLTMSAAAAGELDDHPNAIAKGEMAASIAIEIGDNETAGHAWRVAAASLRGSGKPRRAMTTARRAQSTARNWPAGIGALMEQAVISASAGDIHATFDAVIAAEKAHERQPEASWGKLGGYPFGTYHPTQLKTYAGAVLAKVALYDEAALRLAEAAGMLAGTASTDKADVWLSQARVLLGNHNVDGAVDMASKAVAHEDHRPSAWVARRLRELDKQARGARTRPGPFAGLIERTRGWGAA